MILHIKIYIKMAKFVKENFNIFEGNFRPNKFPNKEKNKDFSIFESGSTVHFSASTLKEISF